MTAAEAAADKRVRQQIAKLRAELIYIDQDDAQAVLAEAIRDCPDWLAGEKTDAVCHLVPDLTTEMADVLLERTGQCPLGELAVKNRLKLANLIFFVPPAKVPDPVPAPEPVYEEQAA